MYVDNFTYFSTSDATERAFKTQLAQEIEVEFMGPVTWFLGCLYVWDTLPDGRLMVHISQTAKIESMLDQFGLTDCNLVLNVYRSGFPIDRLPDNGVDPEDKKELVKQYQSLVGGLNWISLSTHPEGHHRSSSSRPAPSQPFCAPSGVR